MGVANAIASLKSLIRRTSACGDDAELREGLYSRDKMARLLDRERARADRTLVGFSLLVLGPDGAADGHAALVCAARLLRRRLRSTDEAGWLERGRLGAVLPATPPEGARKVGEDLCAMAARSGNRLSFKTYYYPTDFPDGGPSHRIAAWPALGETDPVASIEGLRLDGLPPWKRALDVAGASVGLVLLLPVFVPAAIAVKLTSPGPVLFRQWRSGRGGRPFLMYKFRSMVADAPARKKELVGLNEQDGPAFKIRHDPRVTSVGRFLRGTSIDELPQLWNVLRGEMSLVGPRPLPCDETAGCSPWQRRRLDVTPGITCIWQLHGGVSVSFAEWMRMDRRYITSRSLGFDLRLLFGTIWAILSRAQRSAERAPPENPVAPVPAPRRLPPQPACLGPEGR